MSTKLETIKDSGRGKVDLDITRFWGGKESMLQLTQGFGGSIIEKVDEPGFIQLTQQDGKQLIPILSKWIKGGYDDIEF